ncbi:hypothetical protein TRIUR3_12230 [Triticum urartu]|uniref:Uncharacterized protein n=1 Tax=Triticum urartu TaxID=4572 RepID=M8ABH7_TRIUA|nr:hypothetical protein TRIUR3_12230 [Triticum urartu]
MLPPSPVPPPSSALQLPVVEPYAAAAGARRPALPLAWARHAQLRDWIRTTLAAPEANSIAASGLQAELIRRRAARGSARCRVRNKHMRKLEIQKLAGTLPALRN